MEYIGVTLYVLWMLITMLKFGSLPKNRQFSYKAAILGNIGWYHNLRTLLLIISLGLLVVYAPLKIIYLLITISSILLGFTGIKNFFQRVGEPWTDLGIFLSCTITGILSGIFLVKI